MVLFQRKRGKNMELLHGRIAALILTLLLIAQVLPLPAGGCAYLEHCGSVCRTRILIEKRPLVTDSQYRITKMCVFDEIRVDSPIFRCYTSHCN